MGKVSNSSEGVVILAAAPSSSLALLISSLHSEAPPLARILSIDHSPYSFSLSNKVFTIDGSVEKGSVQAIIPPDISLCLDCQRELLDPGDRRYRYPFINCTNCGPRFSIVKEIPYDRAKTSMSIFPLCEKCQEEYSDPGNRRFHAQPNACSVCGPHLSLHAQDGMQIVTTSPLAATAAALKDGKIVALRGLGGFHLCANAFSSEAVATLRMRKNRPAKPLAVMVPDLDTARQLCIINDDEAQLLTSPEHPIVLLSTQPQSPLADNLAPAIDELGVMLAYTPVHFLLFQETDCPQCLVMTSGNASGAPICTANEDAFIRLAQIADCFLLHNRDIVTRVDDSVIRISSGHRQIFRRARGYVPAPLIVPWQIPPLIGCGAGLKNTFSLARDNSVFCSQHIGDLFTLESYDFYLESIAHLQRLLRVEPIAVACDLHPDYHSSRYAEELGLPLYRVQHHHAHAVAVMAEHQLIEPVLAVVLDGTGFGPDNTLWGGEILLASPDSFTRLGHLSHLPLPGGDMATFQPWRMALSALFALDGEDSFAAIPNSLHGIPHDQLAGVVTMLKNNFNSPLTSSCGRLFDAIAALLGLRQTVSYEGQAAIELESHAKARASSTWYRDILQEQNPLISSLIRQKGEKFEICSSVFIRVLLDDIARGRSAGECALSFHCLLIGAVAALVGRLSEITGVRQVVLSGGCMQNRLLLEGLERTLVAAGKSVFTGETIPVNDGGISVGQTIIGGLRHVSCNTDARNPG